MVLNTTNDTFDVIVCRPLRGLRIVLALWFLGFRCAPPQALRCHPRRGFKNWSLARRAKGQGPKRKELGAKDPGPLDFSRVKSNDL